MITVTRIGSGVHNLDQRIGDIGLRHKSSLRHGSADVHRVRGGSLHGLDAAARAGDRDRRWIGDHLRHSHPLAKLPITRGRTSTTRVSAIIEGEVKLAGDDLHHFQILRHMNMPAGQIESPFPRLNAGQIDFRTHIRRLQAMNHTLRPPYPNLCFGLAGGIDLQTVGKITGTRSEHSFRLRQWDRAPPPATGRRPSNRETSLSQKL